MERRIFHLLLAAFTVVFVLVFARADMGSLVAFVADGAGYYLQIARNVTSGHGLTFDGVHPTNGFHPLWMAVMIALFAAVHATSETMYRLVGLRE